MKPQLSYRLLYLLLFLSLQITFAQNQQQISALIKKASELKYSDWEESKNYINKAEDLVNKKEDDNLKADFDQKAADIFYDRDLFDISLKYALSSYKFYQKNNPKKAAAVENLIAIIYARMNNQDAALSHFRNIYRYGVAHKDKHYSSKALNNIGTIFLNSQKADSALYYYKKVFEIIPENEISDLAITANINMARSFAMLNKNNEAEKKFEKAEESLKKIEEPDEKAFVYNELAKFYIQNNNGEKALKYAELAHENSKVKYSFQNKDALQNLYKAHYLSGNYQKAAEFFQQYDGVKDSLNIEEKAVNLEREKMSNEYKIKEQLIEFQNNKTRLHLLIAILILAGILSVVSFLLIYYRNNLAKEKLEKDLVRSRENELKLEIELKNKELFTKSMLEAERSEMYQTVISELKEIGRSKHLEDVQKDLNSMISKLNRDTKKDSWEEFNLRFNNVYDSFYDKLTTLHPTLNQNDKKICAFIKLNLSSKEIADITKTSLKSVENSRTRLRKKLGLTNSRLELHKYLSKI